MRSATLTERKPEPTGVVIGALIATLLRLIDSSTRSGSGVPLLLVDVGAGLLPVPFELDAGRLEHPPGGLGQLRPGAVAGYERHAVGHSLLLSWFSMPLPGLPASSRGIIRPFRANASDPSTVSSAMAVIEPARTALGATHEVSNQSPPLAGYNVFEQDRPLVEALEREGAGWARRAGSDGRRDRRRRGAGVGRARRTRTRPSCARTTASATASTRSSSIPPSTS